MSKAAKIRELYAHGMSTTEIAGIVGCGVSYVRVVARQRANGMSVHDRKYRAARPEVYRAIIARWRAKQRAQRP